MDLTACERCSQRGFARFRESPWGVYGGTIAASSLTRVGFYLGGREGHRL